MQRTILLFFIGLSLAVPARQCAALCVNAEQANLRTGPGTDYVKSWTVGQYMPFEKVGISLSGEWYALRDVDGDIQWIQKNLLDENCKSAVVKNDTVVMRTGPGQKYARARKGTVEKYHCFKIIEQQGNWIKVRDTLNAEGWIYKKYLWMP